jgi:hypothetical protein
MRSHHSTFLSLTAALALSSATSCKSQGQQASNRTWPLINSPSTPAATGEVSTSRGPDGNTKLTIRVQHLAPADRIARGASAYVAWVVPIEGATQGQPAGQQTYPMTPPGEAPPHPPAAEPQAQPPSTPSEPSSDTSQPPPQNAPQEPRAPEPGSGSGNPPRQDAPGTADATGMAADAPINVGAIRIDANLSGSLDTLTPHEQFQVMITPESDPSARRPTNAPVLSANVR